MTVQSHCATCQRILHVLQWFWKIKVWDFDEAPCVICTNTKLLCDQNSLLNNSQRCDFSFHSLYTDNGKLCIQQVWSFCCSAHWLEPNHSWWCWRTLHKHKSEAQPHSPMSELSGDIAGVLSLTIKLPHQREQMDVFIRRELVPYKYIWTDVLSTISVDYIFLHDESWFLEMPLSFFFKFFFYPLCASMAVSNLYYSVQMAFMFRVSCKKYLITQSHLKAFTLPLVEWDRLSCVKYQGRKIIISIAFLTITKNCSHSLWSFYLQAFKSWIWTTGNLG